jgi:mRNA interferase MazF
VKRGDIVTASAGSGYAGKPRPVLIIQDDALVALDSVVVCPLTAAFHEESILRPMVTATATTGLEGDSLVMTDKVVAVPRHKLGHVVGRIDPATLRKVMRGLGTVIGLGQSPAR